MKNCSHEMQPPHTSVVSSSNERSELAKARRTFLVLTLAGLAAGIRLLPPRLAGDSQLPCTPHGSPIALCIDLHIATTGGKSGCPLQREPTRRSSGFHD